MKLKNEEGITKRQHLKDELLGKENEFAKILIILIIKVLEVK